MSEPTPSQTVGPYLSLVLPWPDGLYVVDPGTAEAITIVGTLRDGAGDPVADGLIETWQADPAGRFDHPADPRGTPSGFRGFGRCPTDADGAFGVHTLRPGPVDDEQAPHIDVSVFARGLLHRLVTRMYFPGEVANDTDPVLSRLAATDRARLVAVAQPDGSLRFDIRLQGEGETPFFSL